MTGTLDDWANAARLLVGGLRVTLLPAPFCRDRAGTGQFPQPGQLGLQLPGFLLQLQDPADAARFRPSAVSTQISWSRPMSRREYRRVPPALRAGSSSPSRS